MDINVLNEKTRMVTGLLKVLGEYYEESPYIITKPEDEYIFYKKDNLELRKYIRTNNINIIYEDEVVFDVSRRTYISGEWEEVLSNYYWRMPVLLLEKEKKQKILKKY